MPHTDREDKWRDQAACTGIGVAAMYATSAHGVAIAKAQCVGCPVREACLAFGLDEEFGVWGGTTPDERRTLREEQDEDT